jgi:hypothetical protein
LTHSPSGRRPVDRRREDRQVDSRLRTVGLALRSAFRVDTAIDNHIARYRTQRLSLKSTPGATIPTGSAAPMTKVGRFTIWVIVALFAIVVVYFMAYSGMTQISPATR